MTRADARQRIIAAAADMGRRERDNGTPRSNNSPQWIAHRAALRVGLSLSSAVLHGMARAAYDAYWNAYDSIGGSPVGGSNEQQTLGGL